MEKKKTMEEKLTIRDQFAMSALAALCGGSWNGAPAHIIADGNKYNLAHNMAVSAYTIADEMIKARNN